MKKTSTKPAPETQSSKPLNKSIKFITILFRGTCPKLTARGKGDLSYELGIDEDTGESYVRISGNDSSGAYSNEWLDLGKIRTLLAGQQKDILSDRHGRTVSRYDPPITMDTSPQSLWRKRSWWSCRVSRSC